MSTIITDAERNADANRAAGVISTLSLHTSVMDLTGSNEAIGGNPVYARKATVFTPAGVVGILGVMLQPPTVGVAWSNQVTFNIPEGSYTHWGAWNIDGIFLRGNVLAVEQNPIIQDTIKLSIGIGPYIGGE